MKTKIILLTILLFVINSVYGQKESKFDIISYGSIGFGTLQNDNEPDYNFNSRGGEVQLNYKLNKYIGISTGFGINNLSGNGFNADGSFYHSRKMMKIPLLGTLQLDVINNLKLITSFGFYTQNIIKDEYQYLNSIEKDVYSGWNFGTQLQVGFAFDMFKNISRKSNLFKEFKVGLNYSIQSDLSSFSSNQGSNNQKLKNLNSVGLMFMIKL